jgi:hypothetical protein
MGSKKRKSWHEASAKLATDLVDRAEEWRYVADKLAEALYLLIEEPNEARRRRADDAISAYENARRQ